MFQEIVRIYDFLIIHFKFNLFIVEIPTSARNSARRDNI